MVQLNFDANTVEPNASFDPLPVGKYLAEITGTQEKHTKAGDGSYLQIELTITDGQYQGRKVWDRLCLRHPNNKAVEIARANLSAICRAVGVMCPNDSTDLHHIPLVVKVGCRNREDTGEMTNEVKGYQKAESGGQVAAQPTDQQPANGKSSPWKR